MIKVKDNKTVLYISSSKTFIDIIIIFNVLKYTLGDNWTTKDMEEIYRIRIFLYTD